MSLNTAHYENLSENFSDSADIWSRQLSQLFYNKSRWRVWSSPRTQFARKHFFSGDILEAMCMRLVLTKRLMMRAFY